MVRVNFDIDEEIYKEFSKKCIDVGKKRAEILRELIIKWTKGELDPCLTKKG
ncbi:MAG: ribbon-helix-helix protein, CopG family [Candidatus Njordarchaeia archaeon]